MSTETENAETGVPTTAPGDHVARAGLSVDAELAAFVDDEALPGSGVTAATFWAGLAQLVADVADRNAALLARRAELQQQLDDWHRANGAGDDPAVYERFLREIGYLVDDGGRFEIATSGVDPEIAAIAGPQLVVPVTNARYLLNAANARWGSLYDALYGTDAIAEPAAPGPYDPARGALVVAWAKRFLDDVVPLAGTSHADVTAYAVRDRALVAITAAGEHPPVDPAAFAGFRGDAAAPSSVFLRHHGLHVELAIDRGHDVGAADPAGLADVRLEAALTAIVDFEDSVATVDGPDKAAAYRNWLGLMRGDLTAAFDKGGRTVERALAPDIELTAADGSATTLRRGAVLLVRNVGLLMTTPAVLDGAGNEIPEGVLDAAVTALAACHDLRRPGGPRNSPAGSVYVVKPKLHGPDEVAFAVEIFARVEQFLELPGNTIKLGLMDEERRTSANLAECIRAAGERVFFVNTGFLDRTGDEIHTAMHAGAVVRKAVMKGEPWIAAYEDRNVDIGLRCGFRGRAQVGKGMWAAPDLMAGLLAEKLGHPRAGANCAWVPSPTAATLHATHYHRVDVAKRQAELAVGGERATLAEMLRVPVAADRSWTADEIAAELDNNAQGILGYVVRWIDQGVGCSKVPDINDVGLMEDRATCRISSQHIANWLLHGVVTAEQVDDSLRRMAVKVDQQNAGDGDYTPMAPGFDGQAFLAARDLVFRGVSEPSGYTEPILHRRRRARKAELAAGS